VAEENGTRCGVICSRREGGPLFEPGALRRARSASKPSARVVTLQIHSLRLAMLSRFSVRQNLQ
jgi:hypothetical protein